MSRVLRAGRLHVALLSVVVLLVLSVPSGAQDPEHMTTYGRSKVRAPERTDAGDWAGTWFYINKRRKMALWMRVEEGTPKLKLRVQERGKNMSTDWDGQSSYDVGSEPGEYSMTIDQRDDKTISGNWVWSVGNPGEGWKETADFSIYRTGRGRQMVMRIENWERDVAGNLRSLKLQIWTFQKASRREALWGELPF